jgi:hypothetical protein
LFWPPAEAAQADYEALRDAALAGAPLADARAVCFGRGGLAALIARPAGEPVFVAVVRGAPRPPWTPNSDPRRDALAASYLLLLGSANGAAQTCAAGRKAGSAG